MIRYWKLSLFCLLALFTFSCEDDFTFDPTFEEEEENSTINEPTTNSNITAEYQTLLDLTNDLRASGCDCGGVWMPAVGQLSWNNDIATAAQRHSSDMDRNNHFDHAGTDGSSPGDRLTAAGYDWRTYGENIALRYRTAQAAFNGWKNSPGHCRNMMNAGFLEMGAAKVGDYYTQDFGAK